MALTAGEYIKDGLVRTATGALSVTTTTSGARRRGGWLVDPDGRLVIVNA